jgi:transcriptional regulator with XRE-family HTH domain
MNDSKAQQIANRLRLAREQAGLSQGQVASKLSLHRPAISEIEAGRRKVSAEELVSFAELYGVDVNWLAQGSADSTDPIVELAARELAKLKKEDLETVMRLLQALHQQGE